MDCLHCSGLVDPDGYCDTCGRRRPDRWDHLELAGPGGAAGLTHKGRAHARNEDAFALGGHGEWIAGVVCDGVTTAPGSERAARLAAWSAREILGAELAARPPREALASAWATAAKVVADLAEDASGPACTFCAAVAGDGRAALAWTGDTRAYWLPDTGPPRTLTSDHSSADGRLTSWLGADSPALAPGTAELETDSSGLLVLASDGFWRYAPAADDVRAASGPADLSVRTRAERMFVHALGAGGADDITVLAIPLEKRNHR